MRNIWTKFWKQINRKAEASKTVRLLSLFFFYLKNVVFDDQSEYTGAQFTFGPGKEN